MFSRRSLGETFPNTPVELFCTACSVPRRCTTGAPFSEGNTWKACGRELVSHQADVGPRRSPSVLAEAGGRRALPWYAGFGLAGGLCWGRDAKPSGLQPHHRNALPVSARNPWLFPVPPTCSPHRRLDSGPATRTQPPGLTGMCLISRHPKPRKGTSLALSDARSQGNSSGPAACTFLAGNPKSLVPDTTLPLCHRWIRSLSGQGKFSRLIENILRMEKNVLRKYLLLA